MIKFDSPRLLPSLLVALFTFTACSDDDASLPEGDGSNDTADSGTETTSETSAPGTSIEPTDSTDSSDSSAPPHTDSGAPEHGGTQDGDTEDGGTTDTPTNPDGGGLPPDGDAQAPGDAGESDPWSGCPSADLVLHDPQWPVQLTVTDEAVYCATFSESRTLEEELAAKLQLRVTPGDYRLPAQDHPSYQLPICLRQQSGAAEAPSEGNTEYDQHPFDDDTEHQVSARLSYEENGQLNVRLQRTMESGEDPAFLLDGKENDSFDFDSYTAFELCSEPGDECFPDRLFTSCDFSGGQLNLHEVTLDEGQIRFELRLGESFAGTEPGAYVRASGTFEGVEFDQTDYFKLVYHPTHHHFERTFVVLFDEPIAGACGVLVHGLEKFGDDVADAAYTVDCDLNRLEPLTVQGHELTFQ